MKFFPLINIDNANNDNINCLYISIFIVGIFKLDTSCFLIVFTFYSILLYCNDIITTNY